MTPTEQYKELDVNKLEQIIADHNKEMRIDMASEITGGTRSKAITDVITVKAILDWHNKQVKNAVATAEDNLDQYWNKELDKQVEEVRIDLNQRLPMGLILKNTQRTYSQLSK